MKKEINNSRRNFITKTVPACAMTCMFSGSLLGKGLNELQVKPVQEKHKFEAPYDKPLTYKQFIRAQYAEAMSIILALEKEMGKEKTIAFLKNLSTERMLNTAKKQAEKSPDTSLNTYVEQFRGGYEYTLTKVVVEDNKNAFELKVTECIWASIFQAAKMGDYGYALVCWADYAWAEGFNPKIKMIRNKTLMEGHDCCNHRYVWEGQ